MRPRPCTTCGALIVFVATREGQRMPVDAASVRPTDDTFDHTRGHRPHWATCPTASRHRKAPKPGRQEG